jgi:RHS repeat-associated protein
LFSDQLVCQGSGENASCPSVYGNTLGYIGRPLSSFSGFYDLRNRQYDPVLRRFLTPDPMGYVDGYDLYQYSGGDPLNYSDPYGLARTKTRNEAESHNKDRLFVGRGCVNCRDLYDTITPENGHNFLWGIIDALGDMFTSTPVYQAAELMGHDVDMGRGYRNYYGVKEPDKDSAEYVFGYWGTNAAVAILEGGASAGLADKVGDAVKAAGRANKADEVAGGEFIDLGNNSKIKPKATETDAFQVRYDPAHPGRPDPKYSIDTSKFTGKLRKTSNGGKRSSSKFWKKWAKKRPETLSEPNLKLAQRGRSPKIDDTWLQTFPEHGAYKGKGMHHHHVNEGRYAIPVPAKAHNFQPGKGTFHERFQGPGYHQAVNQMMD